MSRNMQLNGIEVMESTRPESYQKAPLFPAPLQKAQTTRDLSAFFSPAGKMLRQCHSWSESQSSSSLRSTPNSTRYSSPSDSRPSDISPKDSLIRFYKSREISENDFFQALTPREDQHSSQYSPH